MSSLYSSNNNGPLCQRCTVPLAVNTLQCAHCGYYNAMLLDGGTQQRNQQPPMWNQLPSQALHHEPPRDQSPHRQDGGLLRRYPPVQVEQRNRYTSPSSQPQSASRPISSPLPLKEMSFHVKQQPDLSPSVAQSAPLVGNSNGYTPQFSQHLPHEEDLQNGAQAVSASSVVPTKPARSFGPSFNQAPSFVSAQVPRSFHQEPVKRRPLTVGKTIGVFILLLVMIGGSFLAYAFLFAYTNTQQDASRLPSSPSIIASSVSQGPLLFQDNFIANTKGWSLQSYPGEFSVMLGKGTLKLESENNKLLWELVPGGKQYGDFQLSVDAVLSKGSQENGYGVYIRGTLSQQTSLIGFYRFELYGDGSFAVFKGATDANGTMTTSLLVDYTNSSSILKQGGVNHVTIHAKGSSLQFVVNGQTVSTVSDTAYTSGSVGVFVSNVQAASSGAEATFSHLAIAPVQKL